MTLSATIIQHVDEAIAENLACSISTHPIVSVQQATLAVMATEKADPQDWSEVMLLVCQRSLRRKHVLAFGQRFSREAQALYPTPIPLLLASGDR
jgi:hypothetical protein